MQLDEFASAEQLLDENKKLTKQLEQLKTAEARKLEDKIAQERDDAIRRAEIKELKTLLSAEALRQDMLTVIAQHAPMLTPPKLELISTGSPGRPRHTWVLLLSDLQYGQKTALEASGYVFEQSSAVAREQFALLRKKLEHILARESLAKDVDELVILDLGDNHEGDSMRVSQAMKVDSPVTVQCIETTDLIAELVTWALIRFKKVRYLKVGGNHDRVSSKPGTAGLGELSMVDTFAWLQGEFLRRLFGHAIADGRLNLVNHESWFGATEIAGQRFVYEHGASFRASTGSYGGISYYSIANAAAGYMRMLDGADIVCFGHFHQPMRLPLRGGWGWHIVNGAFPPSTEFVQSNFKGFGRPCQILLDFHVDYGLVADHPLYLETASMLQPGQFWDRVREREAVA